MLHRAKGPIENRQASGSYPYSSLVSRIAGKGSAAWQVHDRAVELRDQGAEIILLSVGDPDFDTPPPIVAAATDSLHQGRTHYTSMIGLPELRQAIADRHARLNGVTVDADQVVVLPGAQCALFMAMMCVVEAGDEVIVPEPMYVTYEALIGATGAKMITVPLRPDRGFHLEPADIAAAINARTRAVLINFPHNPTGAGITRDEMAKLCKICRRNDLWVISDEVYSSLCYDGRHLSPASFPGMAARTIVVDSLSKSHAMPGWRIGWLIGPGQLPAHVVNLVQCVLFGCPPFIQDAALVALTQDFAEVTAMRAAFKARRDLVVGRINEIPRLSCRPPEGSMFAMVDVRETGLDAHNFAMGLVEETGVSVLPGDGFGASAAGYVRMSFTAPETVLGEACNRMRRFAEKLA